VHEEVQEVPAAVEEEEEEEEELSLGDLDNEVCRYCVCVYVFCVYVFVS